MKPFALAALGFSSVGLAHATPPTPLAITEPRNAAATFAVTQARDEKSAALARPRSRAMCRNRHHRMPDKAKANFVFARDHGPRPHALRGRLVYHGLATTTQ